MGEPTLRLERINDTMAWLCFGDKLDTATDMSLIADAWMLDALAAALDAAGETATLRAQVARLEAELSHARKPGVAFDTFAGSMRGREIVPEYEEDRDDR